MSKTRFNGLHGGKNIYVADLNWLRVYVYSCYSYLNTNMQTDRISFLKLESIWVVYRLGILVLKKKSKSDCEVQFFIFVKRWKES